MLLKYVNIHLKTIELLKITLQKERYNAKVSLQYVVCMSEYSHIWKISVSEKFLIKTVSSMNYKKEANPVKVQKNVSIIHSCLLNHKPK